MLFIASHPLSTFSFGDVISLYYFYNLFKELKWKVIKEINLDKVIEYAQE